MVLKQSGNPSALAAERARARNWTRSGMVKGKGLVRVLVQGGCFAVVGVGSSNADAVAHGKALLYQTQKEYRESIPEVLKRPQRKRLETTSKQMLRNLQPSFVERLRLEQVYVQMREAMEERFANGHKVHRFGSVVSGLSLPGGDLDLCLLQDGFPIQMKKRTMSEACEVMRKAGCVDLLPIPTARVPIIKFVHEKSGVAGDLGFSNNAGIVNSLLLKAYVDLDVRFRDLTLIIKKWAKERKIADASKGYLSSYAWTLLALFYLQQQKAVPLIDVRPGIQLLKSGSLQVSELENLQWLCRYFQSCAKFPADQHKNMSSLPTLVDGFFHAYARTSTLGSLVVSTRHARMMRTSESLCFNPRRPAFLHVEDPLLTKINVSRHVREQTVQKLLSEIRRAHQLLRSSGDLDELCSPREETQEELVRQHQIHERDKAHHQRHDAPELWTEQLNF